MPKNVTLSLVINRQHRPAPQARLHGAAQGLNPASWDGMYRELLRAWSRLNDPNVPKPPRPPALSCWFAPNRWECTERWLETAEWAGRFGFDRVLCSFLDGLARESSSRIEWAGGIR
ncbi:MAG TPA: hypothetical protein VFB54_17480 [Burkholderiales bacterium]|nr:hypothetical protein [Burkholderiales bacterium]